MQLQNLAFRWLGRHPVQNAAVAGRPPYQIWQLPRRLHLRLDRQPTDCDGKCNDTNLHGQRAQPVHVHRVRDANWRPVSDNGRQFYVERVREYLVKTEEADEGSCCDLVTLWDHPRLGDDRLANHQTLICNNLDHADFTAVTNQLPSSGQPLGWVTVGGEGDE